MYAFKQTIIDLDNRQAKDIQDFYYRNTEYETAGPKQGTGVRGVARDYFRKRKILERHIMLKDGGNTLEINTYFESKKDYLEFSDELIVKEATKFFAERNFKVTTELYEIQAELSFRKTGFETMRDKLQEASSAKK
jgi:hypothetical protein|tara:strand:+ start:55 stop:462 length:408 start_codon:yes stop_codon:yes gene_type:complete